MRLPQPGCTKPPNVQVCVHHSHGGWKSPKSLRKTRKNALKPETINYPAEHLTRQSISPPWSALFQLFPTTISNDCDGLHPLDPPHIPCPSTWIMELPTKETAWQSTSTACHRKWPAFTSGSAYCWPTTSLKVWVWGKMNWVWIPAPPLTSSEALGKLFHSSAPQFLSIEDNNTTTS